MATKRIIRKRIYKQTRKLKKQHGGEEVELKQVMLNTAMRSALEKQNAERFPSYSTNKERVKANGYFPLMAVLNKGVGGLVRMEGMMKLSSDEFNKLLADQPPKLKKRAITKNGLELYEVEDGRHRVVRAILNGKEKIKYVK